MEVNITGLKCDHCDYRDDTVQFHEYAERINSKCPECGNNLLTEEEFHDCLRIYARVRIINKIGNVLKWINPFHYWRLVFGDNREIVIFSKKYTNEKE